MLLVADARGGVGPCRGGEALRVPALHFIVALSRPSLKRVDGSGHGQLPGCVVGGMKSFTIRRRIVALVWMGESGSERTRSPSAVGLPSKVVCQRPG